MWEEGAGGVTPPFCIVHSQIYQQVYITNIRIIKKNNDNLERKYHLIIKRSLR